MSAENTETEQTEDGKGAGWLSQMVGQQGAQQQTDDAAQTDDGDPDAWYDSLDDAGKARLEAYTKAQTEKLQGALDKERERARKFEKQFKELASKPVDTSEWETKVKEISTELQAERARITFYEGATDNGVAPSMVAKAYKAAKFDNLIDDEGAVDWDALKAEHPYYFAATEERKPARTNAGNGVGTKPNTTVDGKSRLNNLIRGR